MRIYNTCIYKITNIINNKIYIGSAKNFYRRKHVHLSKLKNNIHHNKYLQKAYNKYGLGNFIFDILEECKIENIITREQYYIDTLKPEYNHLKVAYSSIGYKHSEETKERLSSIRKGKQNSLGRILSEETKRKIASYQYGRLKTEQELNKHRKSVIQLSLSGEYINEYSSIKLAAETVNSCISNISGCCKGRIKSVKGYKWNYKD